MFTSSALLSHCCRSADLRASPRLAAVMDLSSSRSIFGGSVGKLAPLAISLLFFLVLSALIPSTGQFLVHFLLTKCSILLNIWSFRLKIQVFHSKCLRLMLIVTGFVGDGGKLVKGKLVVLRYCSILLKIGTFGLELDFSTRSGWVWSSSWWVSPGLKLFFSNCYWISFLFSPQKKKDIVTDLALVCSVFKDYNTCRNRTSLSH